ncbi:DNA topoisomerase IB [Paracoccus sp. S-4012]|uniref:DNA topoisomerase IB n=1 Tax=Paracoccus sp. S-4012 TaxID=2665648 RepID=UPI0012AF99F4|nr:DNA topoisomerase IB [Paracoccus sp. S-4012]MRX49000.1 DNA topoisomerase IB [Paracoccus sp. S-4012]
MPRLRFYPDSRPGFTRRRSGRGYAYFDIDGALIRDPEVRLRIDSIGIPPAYKRVWISPHANGHLQATGRDARGRKQYRYHTDWTRTRSEKKYASLAAFGESLPGLRRWIDSRLRREAGDHGFAVGAVLALIDASSIRVGNPEYAAENGSFGATTLQTGHLTLGKGEVTLAFPAKGGKQVSQRLTGRKLARVLHQLGDLPGADLFTWLDEDGTPCAVTSEEVNDAIRAVCGEGHSAKTFRTWNGTHAAFQYAREAEILTIKGLSQAAADRLHNTPTISRNSYIHPAVLALSKLDDGLRRSQLAAIHASPRPGLKPGEPELLAFLPRAE